MNNLFKVILWISSRAAAFYMVLFLLSGMIVDYKKVEMGTRVRVSHSLAPSSFDYLIEFIEGRKEFNKGRFEYYAFYYEKMVEYMPGAADAHGMLGFCYYYLGRKEHAVRSYMEAVRLEPEVFWFYYNLGVIYFKHGYYEQAAEFLKKGVGIDAKKTFTLNTFSIVIL